MDKLNTTDLVELKRICPGGVMQDIDLAAVSWWRIGGMADLVLRPSSTEELAALLRWFAAKGVQPVVIGQTTNLLFDDAGLRVPCIQIGARMADVILLGRNVTVQAGAWVPGLARKLMQAGLSGLEHVCGIPGTLGGLVCMNGGSKRKSVSSHILAVNSVTPTGEIITRTSAQCGFAYRSSIFQTNAEIITSANLHLDIGPRAEIRAEMRRILTDRRQKFPRKEPNCGSVFKSSPDLYAEIGPPGAIIERLGFKGYRQGGAVVSPMHANFIVNTGDATAADILTLISKIIDAVKNATGFDMEAEVRFVRVDGSIQPIKSHCKAAKQ